MKEMAVHKIHFCLIFSEKVKVHFIQIFILHFHLQLLQEIFHFNKPLTSYVQMR